VLWINTVLSACVEVAAASGAVVQLSSVYTWVRCSANKAAWCGEIAPALHGGSRHANERTWSLMSSLLLLAILLVDHRNLLVGAFENQLSPTKTNRRKRSISIIGSRRSSFSPQCSNISECGVLRLAELLGVRRATHRSSLCSTNAANRLSPLRAPCSSASNSGILLAAPCRCVCSCAVCSATHMAAQVPSMRRPTGRRGHAAGVLCVLCFVVALAWCANVPSDQRTRFGRLRVAQLGAAQHRRLCLGAVLMHQSRWQDKLSWTFTPPPMAPSG